jgi:hypothetical protein
MWTSRLKMEAVSSSKTLVSTYKFTRHYNPEDHHEYLHHHKNLRSHAVGLLLKPYIKGR